MFKSKKKPIFLVTKNQVQGAPDHILIYKTGDDLRQDMLSIQMIRIMDKIWLENGIDFRMKPYRVVATKDFTGVIEFVPNSKTLEKI